MLLLSITGTAFTLQAQYGVIQGDLTGSTTVLHTTKSVGIGTNSPAKQLHLNRNVLVSPDGAINTTIRLQSKLGFGTQPSIWDITSSSGGGFTIGNEVSGISNTRIFVRGDGFVGIGTTAPPGKLTVADATNSSLFVKNLAVGASLQLAVARNNGAWSSLANPGDVVIGPKGGKSVDLILSAQNSNNGAIRFASGPINSDKELMTILPNGNVGVGMNTPFVKMVVADDVNPSIHVTAPSAGANLQLSVATCSWCFSSLATKGDVVIGAKHGQSEDVIISAQSSRHGSIRFQTMAPGAVNGNVDKTERVTITGKGRVGIGIKNPFAGLHLKSGENWGTPLWIDASHSSGGKVWSIQATTNAHYLGGGRLVIKEEGVVDMVTITGGTVRKFSVNGLITAQEVKVNMTSFPDYVFDEDYYLRPLPEVAAYIDEHHHLPDIPSAETVEADGIGLGELNKLLLQKVEELTLYMIEQQKEIDGLKAQLEQ